jgi:hypothetical protein
MPSGHAKERKVCYTRNIMKCSAAVLAWERKRRKTPKRRAYMKAYRRAWSRSVRGRTIKLASGRAWNKSAKGYAFMHSAHRLAYVKTYEKTRTGTPKRRAIKNASCHKHNALARNGGSWSAHQFSMMCKKYDQRCPCCGKKCTPQSDHILALVNGGRNVISNIQPLCGSCNSSKGMKTGVYTCICGRRHKNASKRILRLTLSK